MELNNPPLCNLPVVTLNIISSTSVTVADGLYYWLTSNVCDLSSFIFHIELHLYLWGLAFIWDQTTFRVHEFQTEHYHNGGEACIWSSLVLAYEWLVFLYQFILLGLVFLPRMWITKLIVYEFQRTESFNISRPHPSSSDFILIKRRLCEGFVTSLLANIRQYGKGNDCLNRIFSGAFSQRE